MLSESATTEGKKVLAELNNSFAEYGGPVYLVINNLDSGNQEAVCVSEGPQGQHDYTWSHLSNIPVDAVCPDPVIRSAAPTWTLSRLRDFPGMEEYKHKYPPMPLRDFNSGDSTDRSETGQEPLLGGGAHGRILPLPPRMGFV
ncbi:hypothetical protein M231_07741 [Tremella mesenterica]|uniref:Uncharacterized protein n=1 Tax=Tremella mesenterica TaxID=5217 RepID=A0A4Q1BFF2_TREME|nr:hypothetical protein M231_07741 [Tremella mesenterica]